MPTDPPRRLDTVSPLHDKTQFPVALSTQETNKLVHGALAELGVEPGGNLLMHAAFRTLSRAGFLAERFLDAVTGFIDDGTIAAPAMSWRVCTPENPFFDERATPSNVGVLSEIFRTTYATHRSLHPTHSVAARGREAGFLVADHHLDNTPCSKRSPWGRLIDIDARIVLIGVDMDSCTLMHHFEERFGPDLYLRPEIEVYRCTRADDVSFDVAFRRHQKLYRNFWKFREQMQARGKVRSTQVATTTIYAFAAASLAACACEAFESNRNATLASPGEPGKLM